ncbi:MAG: hypothetical protein ABL867_06925 [Rickettsiales bacterium]
MENPVQIASTSKATLPIIEDKPIEQTSGNAPTQHESPSAEGKTVAEYVYDAVKLHQQQYKNQGTPPPALLKWIGEASLSNEPKNRWYSALGLSFGLLITGTIANIVTGHKLLDGSKVTNVPQFLKPIHGIIKNYDPRDITPRNKRIRYAHAAVYSLGGLLGVKIGTDIAYKNAKEKNKDPQFLEDYLTKISHIQGENWSWLSASSGIFGSASGLWAIPIPGLNYATGMVGRITSMQDRNTTVGGLNKIISGATTDSYLRLKEGAYYLANYAVGNPAKDPEKIEYIAYSILGPIFKEQLTAKHIKQFTDAVHEVRDHYWQEGGIPKDKRAEATDTMKQVFTGAGLEVLLIDMGLNPASVMFDRVNGLIGKLGNVGKADKIKEKQNSYWAALQERLPKYVAANIISQERADWVNESIADMKQGKPPKPAPVIKSEVVEAQKKLESSPRTKETSVNKLVKSSVKPGDWRESILKRRQESESPRLVVE